MKNFFKKIANILLKTIQIGDTSFHAVSIVIAAVATTAAVGGTIYVVSNHFNAATNDIVSEKDTELSLPDNEKDALDYKDEDNNPVDVAEEDVHEHVLTTEIISESTCTEYGTAVDTCECGYSRTYSLPLKEHTPDRIEVVTEATETHDGLQNVYCSVCGQLIETEVIPVIPHDHNYIVTSEIQPTCITDGNKRYTCSICGSYYDEVIPATGHKYGDSYVVDATCTSEGHIYQKCEICGDVIEVGTIEKKDHEFGAWETVRKATCTETGKEKHVCKNCGYEETEEIPALGHNWVEKEVVDSTCSKEGNRKYECSRCGETKIEAIDKKAHTESDWITDAEPTCTGNGSKHTECTVCGAIIQTKTIPATGHSWSAWTTTIPAECETEGTEERTCSVCGETETGTIPALGHQYEDVIDIPATCTTEGEKHQKCSVCGKETPHETVPATGHSFTHYEETVAPTDLTVGKEVAVCDNGCGATDERDIPKLPHTHDYSTEVDGSRVEPTCTEKGHYVLECRCGETLKVDIPALGHDLTVTHTDATCVDTGSNVTTCSRCDYEHVDIIPAKGHTSGEWEITKPATDLEAGEQVRKCVDCGIVLETQEISKLPHTCEHTTLLESQPATCTTDGYELYECRCGLQDRVILPKTNHANSEWVTTKEPTYTEMGERQKICNDCHTVLETEYIAVKPHEHNYVVDEDASTPVTCTEAGTTVMKCTICGNTKSTVTPATGHMESGEIIDTAATCTTAGEKHTECTVCGIRMKTETIPALGHDWGDWIIDSAATEDDAGSRHKECSRCHEKTTEEIPQIPHVHDYTVERVEPDCTTAGYEKQTCSCGSVINTVLPATGHSYGEAVVVEPTCTTDGSSTITCTKCSHSETTKLDRLGHNYVEVERKAATCKEAGYVTYECSHCHDSYTETVEKLAHEYVESSVIAPTCTEKGYTIETCKYCGDTKHTDETDALGHEEGEAEITEGTLDPWTGYYTPGTKEVKCTRCGATIESTTVIPEDGTPYDEVDSIYSVYCGKDEDGNDKYTYVVGHFDEDDATEMLTLINQYRVNNDVGELKVGKGLLSEAKIRAVEIAVNFDHYRPDGTKNFYAENIAMSTIGFSAEKGVYHGSVEDIFNGWIESEGHRENILIERYKYTNIKVFYLKKAWIQTGDEYRYDYEPYWVENFDTQ